MRSIRQIPYRIIAAAHVGAVRVRTMLAEESGQGTTEYAILVGILVLIAIFAITAFRGKVQELWDAITSGLNGLEVSTK